MLEFLPQPKVVTPGTGVWQVPGTPTIGVSGGEFFAAAKRARALWGGGAIGIAAPGTVDALTITRDAALPREGYTLAVTADGVALAAADAAGAFYGVQTLQQLARQAPAGTLPCVTVEDWPDFRDRGLYYDVCRGRVPTLERLLELADQLAHYKINQLQLYVEHTFRWRTHPNIGKNASPLSAEDILTLDECCRARHIELVPSLAAFGHLATVLNLPAYRHLAEDWGEGRYLDPAAKNAWTRGWSLAPVLEESYTFLQELFAEFLPCFSSDRFNVCCDENYDLGWGQSYAEAQRIGKGRLYLNHLLRLRALSAAHGKRIMFWGDIIRHYPELIPEIPRDVTVLDWGYSAWENFDRIADFTATGLPSYGCPSVCGYVTLFPRIHEAADNIAGWTQAGKAHQIEGILNTDWGDGGHYNFLECAWPGYLYGAEQAWNAEADRASFWARFGTRFLHIDTPEFAPALVALGDIAQLAVSGYYQSFWRHVFFACPGDDILQPVAREASMSTGGVIRNASLTPTAALGAETAEALQRLAGVFARCAEQPEADPLGVLPYWRFAVDTLRHAAHKLAVLGDGGEDTPEARLALQRDLIALRRRFVALWTARNRPAEIHVTLEYYDRAIAGLAAGTAVQA